MRVDYPAQLDLFPDGRTSDDWNNGNPGFGLGFIEIELILSALQRVVGAFDLLDKTSLLYRVKVLEAVVESLYSRVASVEALLNQSVRTDASPTFAGVRVQGAQVVGTQITSWQAMAGVANQESLLDTDSVTLVELAERVKAIQDGIATHGLIVHDI